MMKFYVSFGQTQSHNIHGKNFDKDCLAEIVAINREDAYERAVKIFKGQFNTIYESDVFLSLFPKGIIKFY